MCYLIISEDRSGRPYWDLDFVKKQLPSETLGESADHPLQRRCSRCIPQIMGRLPDTHFHWKKKISLTDTLGKISPTVSNARQLKQFTFLPSHTVILFLFFIFPFFSHLNLYEIGTDAVWNTPDLFSVSSFSALYVGWFTGGQCLAGHSAEGFLSLANHANIHIHVCSTEREDGRKHLWSFSWLFN